MNTALSKLGRRTTPPPVSWLMSVSLSRPGIISLAAGFTDNATLPVDEARELLNDLLAHRCTGEPALQYGSTPGLDDLRRLTAGRIEELERSAGNQRADRESIAERLVITHGSQQLLYLVTEVLCDSNDVVLVEDPTYFVFIGIAQSHGLECRGLRLESGGIDLTHLEQVLESLKRSGRLRNLKMLYLVTYHQNPTGTTTAFAKKQGALALLRHYEKRAGHPIYLLEDAAYRELGFEGVSPPSALAVPNTNQRVIYTGTYSKPFATGVRVGFALLPEPVRTAVVCVKGNHDFGTASLLQHLLARAIGSGCYDRHLLELRRRYAEKARATAKALCASFPGNVRWQQPSGGMYFWAALPQRVKTGTRSRFFSRALDCNVLYVPGQLCYAPDPTRRRPNHEMRLSYGNATFEEISQGIARLGRVAAEFAG